MIPAYLDDLWALPLRNGWSDPLTALTIVTSPALAPFTVARSLPLAHALPSLCAAPPAAGCHASARASSRSPPPPPEPLACRVSAIGARLFSRRRLRSQHHITGALAHCCWGLLPSCTPAKGAQPTSTAACTSSCYLRETIVRNYHAATARALCLLALPARLAPSSLPLLPCLPANR